MNQQELKEQDYKPMSIAKAFSMLKDRSKGMPSPVQFRVPCNGGFRIIKKEKEKS